MKLLGIIGIFALILPAVAWEITGSQLRQDIYPYSLEEPLWVEAWGEKNQFFPRYYKESATIQVIVKNNTALPKLLPCLTFEGQKIADVTTRADYAGPVIWYRFNPETVAPGGYALLTVRLRKMPEREVALGIDEISLKILPKHQDLRIQFVSFNSMRDTLNLYIEALKDSGKIQSIEIDGVTVPAEIYNAEFKSGNPALAVVHLKKALDFGSYCIVKIKTERSETLEQIRVRGNHFYLGIIGGDVEKYKSAGFNLLYSLNGNKMMRLKEMTCLSPISSEAELCKTAQQVPAGEYIYGNADEPDAHEPPGLPYMERCGVNIMKKVEPLMALQRKFGGGHLTALMIDTTYAPLNWYTYGQLPDLPFNDCYIPTIFHGYAPERIAHVLPVFQSATAPRPVQMMLWSCCNTNHTPRATTPLEHEIQLHYAIGSGAKGIHYFVDWSSFPNISEGGYFVGVTKIPQLWRSVVRGNALLDRLKELLAQGFSWNSAKSLNPEHIWCKTLLAGTKDLIVTVVNRKLKVHPTDKMKFVHSSPVSGSISVEIPEWFHEPEIYSVAWDRVEKIPLKFNNKQVVIPVKNLVSGRVFVISENRNVEKLLAGTSSIQKSIRKQLVSERKKGGKKLFARKQPRACLNLTKKDKEVILDFSKPETWKLFSEIRLDNAELELTADGFLRMYPGKELRESRAELYLQLNVDSSQFKARLHGTTTPGYGASIELGIKPSNSLGYLTVSSLKADWFMGNSEKEFLEIMQTKAAEENYTICITLKDPQITSPEDCSVGINKLILKTSSPQSD